MTKTTAAIPRDLPAEIALVGSVLLDRTVWPDVIDIVGVPDFEYPPCRIIWQALVDLYEEEGLDAIDVVKLRAWLDDRGALKAVGGVEKLVELGESVPHAIGATHYAGRVAETARRRHLITACERNLERAIDTSDPVDQVIDSMQSGAAELVHRNGQRDTATIAEALAQIMPRPGEEAELGVRTGLYDVDHLIMGMQPADMVIAAGRPSMGKSAFALVVGLNAAAQGTGVLVMSLEMSQDAIGQRIMSMQSGVPMSKIRRRVLTDDDFASIGTAVEASGALPFHICDMPGSTIEQIKAMARRQCERNEIGLVIIDYLQLIQARGAKRYEQVTAISAGMKDLARELRMPVLVVSQLNRAPEQTSSHTPRMSDLRDSGAIEQDADLILLIHREDYYHLEDKEYEPTHTADVIVAKNRQGPPGMASLYWDAECVRFRSLQQSNE